MKLLVVDDIPTNRKLLRVTLEAEGHTMLEAADGIEALLTLDREMVDAVISDILMPNMDGYRLCHEIRINKRLQGLPFIIYSATYTSPKDVQLAKSIGADRYLAKPATAEAMLQALHGAIDQAGLRAPMSVEQLEEAEVLKEYSEALVTKLQEKNKELEQAVRDLQQANGRIVQLNADLECRIKERTAELETTNQELSQSLSEVRELRGILPICSYCKNIRDDGNYWESVEAYISRRTDAQFTHDYCPDCFEKHVQPQLDALRRPLGER